MHQVADRDRVRLRDLAAQLHARCRTAWSRPKAASAIRHSGWDGTSYVIAHQAAEGPGGDRQPRARRADGKQLVEKLHIAHVRAAGGDDLSASTTRPPKPRRGQLPSERLTPGAAPCTSHACARDLLSLLLAAAAWLRAAARRRPAGERAAPRAGSRRRGRARGPAPVDGAQGRSHAVDPGHHLAAAEEDGVAAGRGARSAAPDAGSRTRRGPTYGIGAHPLTALRVYIEWRRLQKPPDNLPLRQTLPPALYARVEALKNRYDPKDKQARADAPDAGRTAS